MSNNNTTDLSSEPSEPIDPRELAKLQLYQVIASIPAGKVASYGQLANLAGQTGAARWVGYCLRHLPRDSTLPWYRIITASGKLAFPVHSEGYVRQRDHLESEGVTLHNHKVNMRHYQWQP
jgi:methylated-DNA-protein-cysteine methyltransferase related protein